MRPGQGMNEGAQVGIGQKNRKTAAVLPKRALASGNQALPGRGSVVEFTQFVFGEASAGELQPNVGLARVRHCRR